ELRRLRIARPPEPPARIILAKAGGLDQRPGLEREAVGRKAVDRLRKHAASCGREKMSGTGCPTPPEYHLFSNPPRRPAGDAARWRRGDGGGGEWRMASGE